MPIASIPLGARVFSPLWLWGVLACLSALAQARTQSEAHRFSVTEGNPACRFFDGFTDNADGTVTDPRSGLVWKRCAEGSSWNGKTCSVAGTEMNWVNAMQAAKASHYLGHTDWRLPTQSELGAVVGSYQQCKSNDWKKGQYAASTAIAHAADKDKSPGWFWSSSPDAGNTNFAWGASFRSGYVSYSYRHFSNMVRLVRANPALVSASAKEFEAEYAKLGSYQKLVDEQIARLKAQHETEEAQRKAQREAQEAQRKAQLNRDAAVQSLLAMGPQALYLEANKLQRTGGGAKISGEDFSPSQIYGLIVDHFPKSGFAVMASDQLSAVAHARAWCQNELQTRESACATARDLAACVAQLRGSVRCP